MRVISVRWIGLLMLVVGVAAAATQATAAEGRWKLGGDGSCYFDAADSGPDQCAPTLGRWKLGGDGSCYFDANDGGPDQCAPVESLSSEIAPDDVAAATGEHDRGVSSVGLDRAGDRRPRSGAPPAS